MVTGPLSGALLLESLDRHFMAGCGFLDGAQLRAHKATGTCPECSARAAAARETARIVNGEPVS